MAFKILFQAIQCETMNCKICLHVKGNLWQLLIVELQCVGWGLWMYEVKEKRVSYICGTPSQMRLEDVFWDLRIAIQRNFGNACQNIGANFGLHPTHMLIDFGINSDSNSDLIKIFACLTFKSCKCHPLELLMNWFTRKRNWPFRNNAALVLHGYGWSWLPLQNRDQIHCNLGSQ